jgi:hypothetical protein
MSPTSRAACYIPATIARGTKLMETDSGPSTALASARSSCAAPTYRTPFGIILVAKAAEAAGRE